GGSTYYAGKNSQGQTALAGGSTYYAGKNSQGQKLLFTVDHTASGPKFDPLFINQVQRCPVTGEQIPTEFTFQGFQIPISNGKFSLVLNDLSDRFRWSGTITSTKASGKESIDTAAFDNKGGLQDCGAGSLSWTARALVPASSATVARGASFVMKVTKASNGTVHFSVTH
ncbi:MAG: hypothetical protein ACTHQQ_24525, partial [Solirubrobacteraceae bacterium]